MCCNANYSFCPNWVSHITPGHTGHAAHRRALCIPTIKPPHGHTRDNTKLQDPGAQEQSLVSVVLLPLHNHAILIRGLPKLEIWCTKFVPLTLDLVLLNCGDRSGSHIHHCLSWCLLCPKYVKWKMLKKTSPLVNDLQKSPSSRSDWYSVLMSCNSSHSAKLLKPVQIPANC